MDWYKVFSAELGACYFEQNSELTDEELSDAYLEDLTILEGELMGMLMDVGMLEDFE